MQKEKHTFVEGAYPCTVRRPPSPIQTHRHPISSPFPYILAGGQCGPLSCRILVRDLLTLPQTCSNRAAHMYK